MDLKSILLKFDEVHVGLGTWDSVNASFQKEQKFVLQENRAGLELPGWFMSYSVYIIIFILLISILNSGIIKKYKNLRTISNKEVLFARKHSWDWDTAIMMC